ncbi:hypothetical protein K505DRAFT_163708 [Melanomma pulvis-pyrius CBS 109.77]|uniref:Uncharacterized protein n=1 Tax=Melanomma pulvis-pyrius CBS 109.77 TaxID=1314802 RepID=A0A6A6XIU6_9PLEO|nr:hypothetical protein K505DRAFT_163708 [Melanomma pulvis-pyrius CBS 109.77]
MCSNMSILLLPTRSLIQPNSVSHLARLSICRPSQRLPFTALQSHIPVCWKSTQTKTFPTKSAPRPNKSNLLSPRSSNASKNTTNGPTLPSTPKPKYMPYTPPSPPPPRLRSKPGRPQWPPRPESRGRQGLSPALAGWLMGVALMGGCYALAYYYDVKFLLERWWMSASIMVFLLFLVF